MFGHKVGRSSVHYGHKVARPRVLYGHKPNLSKSPHNRFAYKEKEKVVKSPLEK